MSLNAQVSAGARTHRLFRSAQCGQIQSGQPCDRAGAFRSLRGARYNDRPGPQGDGTAPIGPVVIIDTPGLDDEGTLGENGCAGRAACSIRPIFAVLVVDAAAGLQQADRGLTQLFEERQHSLTLSQ